MGQSRRGSPRYSQLPSARVPTMSVHGRSRFRRSFVLLASVAAAACAPSTEKGTPTSDSAVGPMSKGRMTSMVMPTDVFSGRCGTGAADVPACLGGLPTLKAGWSGNTLPYDLTEDVAKEIATVVDTFPPGSEVSVPRKT